MTNIRIFCMLCEKFRQLSEHECVDSLCQPEEGVHVDICKFCTEKLEPNIRLQVDGVSSFGPLTHQVEIPPSMKKN